MNETEINLTVGDTFQLVATTVPSGAEVVWYIEDYPDIASVNNGLVTADAVGTCTVTAEIFNGAAMANCVVNITEPQYSIELNETDVYMNVGDTFQLVATTVPAGAEVNYWVEDADAVVSVNSNGLITAYALGKNTITAELEGGAASTTCDVHVTETNLAPVFSADVDTQSEFWKSANYLDDTRARYCTLDTDTGICSLVYNPDGFTTNLYADMRPALINDLVDGATYTLMVETFAEDSSALGNVSFSLMASNGNQIRGANVLTIPTTWGRAEYYQLTAHNTGVETQLFTLQANGTPTATGNICGIRISLYEGTYSGEYAPYEF